MGNGVVIELEIGVVTAPADGELTLVMEPSLHAVGLKTKEGLNVLRHLGIVIEEGKPQTCNRIRYDGF